MITDGEIRKDGGDVLSYLIFGFVMIESLSVSWFIVACFRSLLPEFDISSFYLFRDNNAAQFGQIPQF